MASRSRKDRGMRSQLVVAQWFKARGWPYAEPAGSGRPGVDVLGTLDIAVQIHYLRCNPWDNESAPGGATNTLRGLTRSSDATREGLA